MSEWEDIKARLSVGFMGHVSDGSCKAEKPCMGCDIRAALGEIERQKEKLQEWSDWEAMLHTQLERVVGGSGRGCDSLVETLRLRLLACEKEIDRKDNGYAAIIKMERDARDQFRERAEAAEADNERLRDLIVALSEDERGLVTGEVHAEADRIRAALRGGGEPKAHADDCPCVMCDPMQVRLDQQLRAMRGGGK